MSSEEKDITLLKNSIKRCEKEIKEKVRHIERSAYQLSILQEGVKKK